jgi:Transglycosylase SLT domain
MALLNVGGGLSYRAPKPVAKFNVDTGKKVLPKPKPVPVYNTPAYTAPKTNSAYTRTSTPTSSPATMNLGGSSYSPASAALAQAAPAAPSFQDLTKQYLDDSRSEVNKLYDQQKNSRLQALKAQRDAAIGKINVQKQGTQQSFYNQRNQQDVVNAQNVARLREIMAANGINASGENLSFQAQANSDRQNSLNDLNQQEQSQMSVYDNQISEINNPAEEQSIISQIESERSKAILDAQNTAVERAWRSHTFNNMSASEKATLEWAKQQYGEDAAWKMFELQYNGNMQQATNQAQIAALGFNGTQGGGGKAASGPQAFQSHMSQAVARGVDSSWVPLLSEIVKRESSFNPNAKNPKSTAYGYGQFLSSTRSNYEKKTGLSYSDPVNQLIMMAQYVKDRYGSPANALAFWNKNHWY